MYIEQLKIYLSIFLYYHFQIIRGVGKVQTMMCEANNDLKSAMISLPKLHLTVRVACLENEEHIAR